MAMSSSPQARKTPSVSDYLAAERTFLARIRTGIAFMGLGFVIAHFGLFLEWLTLLGPGVASRHQGLSITAGKRPKWEWPCPAPSCSFSAIPKAERRS